MPLTNVEKVELEMALNAVRLMAENDAAKRITLEWKTGAVPKVVYVPAVALEYISVQFTVRDENNA